MRPKIAVLVVITAVVMTAAFTLLVSRRAAAQSLPPSFDVERLRFRIIGDEPIAAPPQGAFPARLTIAAGWKAEVIRDTVSGQCYIAFLSGSAMSVAGPGVCP